MNRSHLASSRVLSVPERIDKWSSSIHPTRLDQNLSSTISLIQNLANPLMGIYLITDKLTNIQNNAFVQIMRSCLDQIETMCQNLMIQNLKRISEGKPLVISSISTFKDTQQKNIYKGSMLIMSLIQKRGERAQQSNALSKIKSYSREIQPEEEEDNQELMKFFEGVRRYQDHHEKRALEVTEKLKRHKDVFLRKREIKRGFQLCKMEKALNGVFKRPKSLLFKYHRRTNVLTNLNRISDSYQNRMLHNSFSQLFLVTKRKTMTQLFKSYQDLNIRKQLLATSKQLKSLMFKKMNKRTSLRKIQMVFHQKQASYKTFLLSFLKSQVKLKLERLSQTFIKLSDSFLAYQKRKSFKKWALRTHHRLQTIVGKLKTILWKRINGALNRIETHFIENRRPILSDRTKGKIVASVIRIRHQDINLRQHFLKWWLKAKPEAIEKKFMHMFLHAPTRPFTYFLRLKNMVKQSKIPKISPKSILFVLLIKEKTQKFLKYKVKNAVQKWDKWNKTIKVLIKMNKNLQRLQNYTNQQLTKYTFRTLLEMFAEFNNRKRLMMRIFNVIGGTGIGKVFKSVEIWKKLPDNRELKKRQMMLGAINRALSGIRRQVKSSFEQFKQYYLIGEEKKRSAALIMLRSAGGSVSQSFKKWQDSMRITKTINKCRSISTFLESVTVVATSQYGIIFQNPRQAYLREKYLTRLILTQTGNITRYFTILVNALKAARMNDQIEEKQKKFIVSRISNMVGNQSATGVKTALQKLYVNMKVKQKQINFMKRLMQTKGGKLFEAIRIWKDLPEKNAFSKVRNGHKFFSVLKKLADKVLIHIFKQYIDDFEDGEIKKRRSMSVLMSMTSSDVRKYYMRWYSDTKKRRILAQCATAMTFMESLTDVVTGNMTIIFESQRASMLKQKCFNKMMDNLGGGLKTCLRKWMRTAKELTMQGKINLVQRRHYVSIISNGINNKKSDLIKYSIASLSKNMRMKRIAKSFFNKLMDTQSGMVIRAIQTWHGLPSKDSNMKKQRAIKFQKTLQDMAEKVMRFSYNQFKSEQLYGESKQKYILNKLVKRCMSYEQKKYIHWKVVTKELALLEKARLVMKSFENIHSTVAASFKNNFVGETKSDLNFKGKLISELVRNNVSAMQSAFSTWRGWYQNIKTNNRYHKLTRLIDIWEGKRLKKQSFTTIFHEKELQTQRTYINSLWRWKTSQFEAEYYNKFLQMFNESQVLLTFSKILNNKLYSVYSYGFTKIKQVKNQQQFKYNIVKKYFLKRLSSYFQRFKQEVKGRQIERWRYKFQDSIRGMLMLQALQKAIKKIKSYELNNWNKRTKKYFKWKQAIQRLGELSTGFKQYALKMIRRKMLSKRIQLGAKILNQYQNNNKLEAFNRMYRVSKIMKMISVLDKSWRKTERQFLLQLQKYSIMQGSQRAGLLKLNKFFEKKQHNLNKSFVSSTKKRAREIAIIKALSKISNRKRLDDQKLAVYKIRQQAHNAKILVKYKAAQRIYGVYQNICRYVVNKHFSHWRKIRRDSIWLKKSVEMIATKPSIKSSLAISMWRMKVYAEKQNSL